MHSRTCGLAALCAVVLLAVPGAASAATPTTVVAGPLKVKDYSMTVTAADGSSDSLNVMFNRPAGKASQLHFHSFTRGVKVTTSASMAAARITANLGRYGKIDLKLTGAGVAKRGVVPKGCTGRAARMRAGTLKGSYRLVADSTYFKTVSAKRLKAQLFEGGSLKCEATGNGDGTGGTRGATRLSSTIQGSDGMLTLSVSSVMHLINAPGPGSAFAPAGDLSSATGTGLTPFLSGAFSFASDYQTATMATGTLTGGLAARFDSIGTQQIAASAPAAILTRG